MSRIFGLEISPEFERMVIEAIRFTADKGVETAVTGDIKEGLIVPNIDEFEKGRIFQVFLDISPVVYHTHHGPGEESKYYSGAPSFASNDLLDAMSWREITKVMMLGHCGYPHVLCAMLIKDPPPEHWRLAGRGLNSEHYPELLEYFKFEVWRDVWEGPYVAYKFERMRGMP